MGEHLNQLVVVEYRGHALRSHRKLRHARDGPDHRAELLALDSAGRDAHLGARLDALALLGGDIDHRLELRALVFNQDDRRADGEHRTSRYLDFEHAPRDRTENLRIAPQGSGERLHLAARIIGREFGLLQFMLALGFEIGFLCV